MGKGIEQEEDGKDSSSGCQTTNLLPLRIQLDSSFLNAPFLPTMTHTFVLDLSEDTHSDIDDKHEPIISSTSKRFENAPLTPKENPNFLRFVHRTQCTPQHSIMNSFVRLVLSRLAIDGLKEGNVKNDARNDRTQTRAGLGTAGGYDTIQRLLHLKGARIVRCVEVSMTNMSLNTGDVFILDLGCNLFLWNGEESNSMEKAKGLQWAEKIRNARDGDN